MAESDRKPAKVLVLGGTGRVGGSTARALVSTSPAVQVVVAGRNRYAYTHPGFAGREVSRVK